MLSTDEDLRAVPLGQTFTAEIPLGPNGGTVIRCYASTSLKSKLHGDAECKALRTTSTTTDLELSLSAAVGRLCTRCRWPLPTDSPVLLLGAAIISVDSLKIWIDREPDPDEDIQAERDAVLALATGEYPPSATSQRSEGDGEDEAFDDEEWNRYARARDIRQNHFTHWRRLHSYLARSIEAVSDFPFLRPWAEPLQVRLAAVLDEERRAFAALLQPDSLREAAAVRLIQTPEFTPGPEFAGLGNEAARTFRRAWHEWNLQAAWSWHRLEEHDFAIDSVLRDAFGRRRKGRPEAEAAFERLAADWIAKAHSRAAQPDETPWQLIGVKAPALTRGHYTEPDRDPLTHWESAVLATYQVAFDHTAGTAALLVPELIAEQLAMAASSTMPVARLGTPANALPAEMLLSHWQPDETTPQP